MFQQQYGGGFQKFPSLCDPRGSAPSVPQHWWVCDVQLGPPRNGWGWCAESQAVPKCRGPTSIGTSKPSFSPLFSLHSWIGGGPARVRMLSLKLLVFTVGREKSSKAGLGVPPAAWLLWGLAAVGAVSAAAAPLCPFELGPWGEHCCSISSPTLFFIILKVI